MQHALLLGHTPDVATGILKMGGYFVLSTVGIMVGILAIVALAGRFISKKD